MGDGKQSRRSTATRFVRLWGWCFLLAIGLAMACVAPVALAWAVEPIIRQDLQSGHRVRVVCFGDSVTGVYYHTGGRRAYTDMLGIALRRTFPTAKVEMINAGISGNTTDDGLVRIDHDVLGHRPDLVTVMFGLNDMTRVPLKTYRANLKTIVRKCRGAGASVVLATPNCVVSTPARPTEKLLAYCDVVRQVARELDVPLSDCYQATDAARDRDAMQWRLLMSDAIHPNMEGHKLLAEQLNQTVTGRQVSLADIPPPQPAIPRTLSLLRAGKPVRVLAMTPSDTLIESALRKLNPHAEANVHPWPVAGLSLEKIEQDAKQRVRPLKPDLVIIAVPRQAAADSDEAFIRAYSWIMNWSLSFSHQQWDCVVLHPSVLEPADWAADRDELVRHLVRAQDLTLIDRSHGSTEDAETILQRGLRQ